MRAVAVTCPCCKRDERPDERRLDDVLPLPPLIPSDTEEVSRTGLDAEIERRRMYGPRRSWREDEV